MPAKTEPQFVAEFASLGAAAQFNDEQLTVTGVVVFGPEKRDGDYYVSEKGAYYAEGFHESIAANLEGALGYPRHPKRDAAGNMEERDAGDAIYTAHNPRVVEEKGVKKVLGDLQFFEDAKRHYQRMKRGHQRLGLSIFAPSLGRRQNRVNEFVSEKIDEASHLKLTVDFGESPSATKNIFEFGPKPTSKEDSSMDPKEIQALIDKAVADNSKLVSEKLTTELDKLRQESADLRRKQLIAEKLTGKPANLVTESLLTALSACAEDKVDGLVKQHFETLGRSINPVTGMGGDGTIKGVAVEKAPLPLEQRIEMGATQGVHALVSEMGAGGEKSDARTTKMSERFIAEFGWLRDSRFTGGKWTERRAEMLQGWNPRLLTKTLLGHEPERGMVREAAIMSTAFQNINNLLLAATVIARYEILESTRFIDRVFSSYVSSKELETWPGYKAPSAATTSVAEGAEYPDADMEEKYAQDIRFGKYGAKVRITEEEVLFDQPGQVMMRANRVTDFFALLRARQILRAFYDATSWECYRPNGVQTDLWTSANTLADNPLVDFTSVWPIRTKLRSIVDENGNRIDQALNPLTLLIPTAIEDKAHYLANASMVQVRLPAGTSDRVQEMGRPFNIQVEASTLLDDLNDELYGSTDNTYFAAGPQGYADQFLIKKHFPFGAENLPPDEVKRVSTDTIGGVRVRYKERLFAIDNKRVVRVLKGTTS